MTEEEEKKRINEIEAELKQQESRDIIKNGMKYHSIKRICEDAYGPAKTLLEDFLIDLAEERSLRDAFGDISNGHLSPTPSLSNRLLLLTDINNLIRSWMARRIVDEEICNRDN